MYLNFGTATADDIAAMNAAELREHKKYQFRECFTRTPNIQKLVTEQLALYEPLAEREAMRAAIPDFINLMITDGISSVDGGTWYGIRGDDVNQAKELLNLRKEINVVYMLFTVAERYRVADAPTKALAAMRMEETTDVLGNMDNTEAREAKRKECADRIKSLRQEVQKIVNLFNTDVNFNEEALGRIRDFYIAALHKLDELTTSVLYWEFM